MKKLLLIGLILAITILAMPQGVSAATATPVVNANILHPLEFSAPSPSTAWTLTRGASATDNYLSDTHDPVDAAPIVITVSTAQSWDLKAKDNAGGLTVGKMLPTPNPGFTPLLAKALTNAVQVEVPGGTGGSGASYSPLTSEVLIRGAQTPGYYTWNEDLKQTVATGDYALTSGQYQITITFSLNEL